MDSEIKTKDLVCTSAGRLGRVVGYMYQQGQETVYHILWLDTEVIEECLEGSFFKYYPIMPYTTEAY